MRPVVVIALLSLGVLGACAAPARACTADEYAREHFAEWDTNGDGILSEAELELSLAEALGIPDLFVEFPQMRTHAHEQFLALAPSSPNGLLVAEFATAASAYALTYECAGAERARGAARRRRLAAASAAAGGIALPGETKIPGLWYEVDKLRGDTTGMVEQMTLFNSNQLRTAVKVWANGTFASFSADADKLGGALLQTVICGGQGACSPIQLQLITGASGLLGNFLELSSVFLAKLTMYVVPSFSLVQAFHVRGAFAADLPSADASPIAGVPAGGATDSKALLDLVALLHIVPGEDAFINKMLAGVARLPMYPAVAVAHFAQDGGFELDFRLGTVLNASGGDSRRTPVFEATLHHQLSAMATAYEELFEFGDLNANGVFDAGEPVGAVIKLGEVAWRPIRHTTSDGSCMTESDLSTLGVGALRALCAARGLPHCASATDQAALVAYLDANPLGCSLNVDEPVILLVESRTAEMSQFPAFSFAIQFMTSSRLLQNEAGVFLSPNRAKVNVEIQNFPFSLPVRPRLALKVAHAAAAPVVNMSVDGAIDLSPPFNLSAFDLSMLRDALGSFPHLPPFPLPQLPSTPALPGLPGWLPWSSAQTTTAAAAGALGAAWSSAQTTTAAAAGALGAASVASDAASAVSRLVMSQANGVELNRWGRASPTAVYTAAAARAAAAKAGAQQLASQLFGGDTVAQLLSNGSLVPLPSSVFASTAYSTWDQYVHVDAKGTRARVTASALGTAGFDVGGIAGLGAHFLAGVNATASRQVVSIDSNSSYILWDPVVGLGEPVEWRKARAEAAAAAAVLARESEASETAPTTEPREAPPTGAHQIEVTSEPRALPEWLPLWLPLCLCAISLLGGVALYARRRRARQAVDKLSRRPEGGKAAAPTAYAVSSAPSQPPASVRGPFQTAPAPHAHDDDDAAAAGRREPSESRV